MKTLLTAVSLFTFLCVNAQKQPQIQELSVRAPANVKIDGQLKEWANPFLSSQASEAYLSAYNSSSRYYYSIANDDVNLYIILRGLGTAAAQKALMGGIIFTINRLEQKKIKTNAPGNIVITYPMPQNEKTRDLVMGPIFSLSNYLPDTINKRKQIDSLVTIGNKRADDVLKEIGVAGIKEIKDSTISIYNEHGIRAAMGFRKRMPMIELAIPLKYFGIFTGDRSQVAYNIRLNGLALPAGVQIDSDLPMNEMYSVSTSDFGGIYILKSK